MGVPETGTASKMRTNGTLMIVRLQPQLARERPNITSHNNPEMSGLLPSILWKAESIPLSLVFLGNNQDLSHSDDMHSHLHVSVFPHLTQPPTVCPLVSQLFYILISPLSSWSYHTHLPHPNSAINLSQIIIYAWYETRYKFNFFQIDMQLLQHHFLKRFPPLHCTALVALF